MNNPPIINRTLQPSTIDELIRIDEAVRKVTEQQQTIVYIKATKTYYWLNEENKIYQRLEIMK